MEKSTHKLNKNKICGPKRKTPSNPRAVHKMLSKEGNTQNNHKLKGPF